MLMKWIVWLNNYPNHYTPFSRAELGKQTGGIAFWKMKY